jgi:hypothetical protein
MKYAKVPKKYKLTKDNPAVFRVVGEPSSYVWLWRIRIPRIIFRLICRIKGHVYRLAYPYGMRIKKCERCAYVKSRKPTREKPLKFTGEIGELYGVKFITSKK